MSFDAKDRALRAGARGALRSDPAPKRSWPAGTGVWVVKTTSRATRGTACSKLMPSSSMRLRMASSTANPLCPSLRCSTPGVMPMARKRAQAADAQQQFLADADAPVAAVEARSQLAIFGRIAFHVRIEQQQIAAADLDAPDFRPDGAAARSICTITGSPFVPIAGSMGSWFTSVCRYSSCCQPSRPGAGGNSPGRRTGRCRPAECPDRRRS